MPESKRAFLGTSGDSARNLGRASHFCELVTGSGVLVSVSLFSEVASRKWKEDSAYRMLELQEGL